MIEDDKDDRFLSVESEGYSTIDRQSWNEYQEKLLIKIGSKRPNIPVFIMLAAPEVEAWFLADWENSFGNVYEEKLGKMQNKQFEYQFHQFVNQKILTDHYRSDLENYGCFKKSYHKLSEEIQKALLTNRFLYETDNSEEISVTYSKRNEGSRMLSTIEPEHVEKNVPIFSERHIFS